MKPVVRKGDPTTTGGVVIEGAADSSDMGRPIARKGDWATCPLCQPHGGPIAEGHEQWHIKGRPVALHGHVVACGCPWGSNKVLSTQFEDGVMPGGQGMGFAAKESQPAGAGGASDFQGMGFTPREAPEPTPGRGLSEEEYCTAAKELQGNQDVQAALKEIAKKTKEEEVEYSCWFVKNPDGSISAVNMKTDDAEYMVYPGKKPEGAIGQVHTHVHSAPWPSEDDTIYMTTQPIEERPMIYMITDSGGTTWYLDDAGNDLPCQKLE